MEEAAFQYLIASAFLRRRSHVPPSGSYETRKVLLSVRFKLDSDEVFFDLGLSEAEVF